MKTLLFTYARPTTNLVQPTTNLFNVESTNDISSQTLNKQYHTCNRIQHLTAVHYLLGGKTRKNQIFDLDEVDLTLEKRMKTRVSTYFSLG
jgi:hypothetical protein